MSSRLPKSSSKGTTWWTLSPSVSTTPSSAHHTHMLRSRSLTASRARCHSLVLRHLSAALSRRLFLAAAAHLWRLSCILPQCGHALSTARHRAVPGARHSTSRSSHPVVASPVPFLAVS